MRARFGRACSMVSTPGFRSSCSWSRAIANNPIVSCRAFNQARGAAMDLEPNLTHLRQRSLRRVCQLSGLLALALAVTLPAACTEVPPNLPTSEAFKRNAPRIELVPLVIGDTERAERVRSLYIEVESLMLATKVAQAEQWKALLVAKD